MIQSKETQVTFTLEEVSKRISDAYEYCARVCENFGQSNWSNKKSDPSQMAFDCARLIRNSLIVREDIGKPTKFPYLKTITVIESKPTMPKAPFYTKSGWYPSKTNPPLV